MVEAARHYKRPETWRTWVVHSNDTALIDGGSLRAWLVNLGVVADGMLRMPVGCAVAVEPVADPVKRIMVNVGSALTTWRPGGTARRPRAR